MQKFNKFWNPTLTRVGLNARSTVFTNGPERARRIHSVWGRGRVLNDHISKKFRVRLSTVL